MMLKSILNRHLLFQGRCVAKLKQQIRSASIQSALNTSPILVSSNKDIYTNLALEHWLYTNLEFVNNKSSESDHKKFDHPVVLIWTDEPSIVIGRHQNPWVETSLGLVNKLGVKLARRHSGGGCVYHDENNINISIIGHRDLFSKRQENLRFLANVLNEKYGIKCEPNERHDLIHSATGLKLSGSAAKLGKTNCYHHFTLLVNSDKEVMRTLIRQQQQEFITTNSSLSTRSSVTNLCEHKFDLTVDQVVSDLSQSYAKFYTKTLNASKAVSGKNEIERDEFDSLNRMKQELLNPDWIFGMTPKFKLEQSIDLLEDGQKKVGKMIVYINKGKFDKIEIDCDLKERGLEEKFQPLIGTAFTYKDAMVNTVKLLGLDKLTTQSDGQLSLPNASEQIFATLLLKIIQEAHF